MSQNTPYPGPLRLLLAVVAVLLIVGLFATMTALTKPSRFVTAVKTLKQGPSEAAAFQSLPVLNFHHYLYLHGPIRSAAGEDAAPLFRPGQRPALSPAVFEDGTGAFEILAHDLPLMSSAPDNFSFGEPLHFLGWRTSTTALTLFAVARTHEELHALLTADIRNWKTGLFLRGLLLAGITFTVFWFLNIALLSTVSLRLVQILIVNVVFLVLYFSVLIMSAYPLLATLPQTLWILVVANAVFIPLSLALRPRS